MTRPICPETHTASPDGLAWYGWIERMIRTHSQHQCPDCGLWAIYKRRKKLLRKQQVEALLYPVDDLYSEFDLASLLDDRLTESERANVLEAFAVES